MGNNKGLLQRFMDYVTGDWQWTGCKTKSGYGRIGIGYKTLRAHRVSYELFNGPIPDDLEVLHSCDDPGCVNPEHLHLGSAKDNFHEMLERGRDNFAIGENHGMVKLTERQVIEIRERCKTKCNKTKLAKEYGVSLTMIHNIVRHKNWKHLP